MDRKRIIFSKRVKQVLREFRASGSTYGLLERDIQEIEHASSYKDLRRIAIKSLRKMNRTRGGEIWFFSGPLRTGPQSVAKNMIQMQRQMERKDPLTVFNQLLFFEKIIELEKEYPNSDSMEEFFLPVIASGYITHLEALPFCDKSEHSQREIRKAVSLGLNVT